MSNTPFEAGPRSRMNEPFKYHFPMHGNAVC